MSKAYMPESKSTEWGTPWDKFNPLHSEFNFTVDVAAADWNAKLPRYYTRREDGLAKPWKGETAWCNPPYGAVNIEKWLAKAKAEADSGTTTCLLLPNTTDTKWFHKYVWDVSRNRTRDSIELRFFEGRINFDIPDEIRAARIAAGLGDDSGNVKGSILVVVRPKTFTIHLCPTCNGSGVA